MTDTRKVAVEKVADRIKRNGSVFGNKSSNLMELDDISKSIKNKNISVLVPEIFPLADDTIKAHLDQYGKNWITLWQEFVKAQGKNTELTMNAKNTLQVLRKLIMQVFTEHAMENVVEKINLPAQTLFMVRSTGEEDTVEVANPGGNKSVAAVALEKSSMSRAIGVVVASYISEKSLMQRLLSGDDISKPSFMPVLIQRMIGEKLDNKARDEIVVSGVMYANQDQVSIDVAPGHGELIVNSKAMFDTYEMKVQTGIVHAQIHQKDERLVPVETEERNEIGAKKRKLMFRPNPPSVKSQPSLDTQMAKEIMDVGKLISDHYNMPMDIEFVYHPLQKVLYLVQARPIPQCNKVKVEPCAISPEHWLEFSKDQSVSLMQCNVVVKGSNAAKVLTKRNEFIADKQIGGALKKYLSNSSLQASVRAVFIEAGAPASSHEAAFFNSQGIPVFQTPVKKIKKLMKNEDKVIVADPQRKTIFDLTQKVRLQDAESILKRNKVIVDGLFVSSASIRETLLPANYELKDEIKAILKNYLPINLQIDTKNIYGQLLECLQQIENVKAGDKNESAFAALQKAAMIFKKIGTSTRAQDENAPHSRLFQHAMFAISEIHYFLEDLSKQVSVQRDTNIAKLQNVLDAAAKLKGLVTDHGEAGLYSDSIWQIAESNQLMQDVDGKITVKQRDYMQQFLKLNKLAFTSATKKSWTEFIKTCSANAYQRNLLAATIVMAAKYHMESELINDMFVQVQKNTSDIVVRDLFSAMNGYVDDLQKYKFNENERLINNWTARLDEWSDPQKFDGLYTAYINEIVPLSQTLGINTAMTKQTKHAMFMQVRRLTDLMDKTIKSMKGSPEYAGNASLQVKRFVDLLNPYHALMEKWMREVPDTKYNEWQAHIGVDRFNGKAAMIQEIAATYKIKSNRNDAGQLQPSGCLSVASATVGSASSFERQFVKSKDQYTLEDLFSLMHQNILACTVTLEDVHKTANTQVPEEMKKIKDVIDNMRPTRLFGVHQDFPVVTVEYNIPLENHSAKLFLEYNTQSKSYSMQWKLFGMNGVDWNFRMNEMQNIMLFDGLMRGLDMPFKPFYDEKKKELTCTWNFKADTLEAMVNDFTKILSHYMLVLNRNGDVGTDYKKGLDRSLSRFSNLDNKTQSDFINGISPENVIQLHDILNRHLSTSELRDVIDKCPSLIFIMLDQLQLMDNTVINRTLNNGISKTFIEKLIQKLGVNYSVSISGVTLFDKMLELCSSNEVFAFLDKYKPNLAQQRQALPLALTRPNPDAALVKRMISLGAPLASITPYHLDGVIKTNLTDLLPALEKQVAEMNSAQFMLWVEKSISRPSPLSEKKLQLILKNKAKFNFNAPGKLEMICKRLNLEGMGTNFLMELIGNQSISLAIHTGLFDEALRNKTDSNLADLLMKTGTSIESSVFGAFSEFDVKNAHAKELLFTLLSGLSPARLTGLMTLQADRFLSKGAEIFTEVLNKFIDRIDFTDNKFIYAILNNCENDLLVSLLEKKKPDLSKLNNVFAAVYSSNMKRDINLIILLESLGAPVKSLNKYTTSYIMSFLAASNNDGLPFLLKLISTVGTPEGLDPSMYTTFISGQLDSQKKTHLERLLFVMEKSMQKIDVFYKLYKQSSADTTLLEKLYNAVLLTGRDTNYLLSLIGPNAIDFSAHDNLLVQAFEAKHYDFAKFLINAGINIGASDPVDIGAIDNTTAGREALTLLCSKLGPTSLRTMITKASTPLSKLVIETLDQFSSKLDTANSDLLYSLIHLGEPEAVMTMLAKKKIDLRNCANVIDAALTNPKATQKYLLFLQSNGAPTDSFDIAKLLNMSLTAKNPELLIDAWVARVNASAFTKLIHEEMKNANSAEKIDLLLQVMLKFKQKLNWSDSPNGGRTFFKVVYDALMTSNHSLEKLPEIIGSQLLNLKEMPDDAFKSAFVSKQYGFAKMLVTKGSDYDSWETISFDVINPADTAGKDLLAEYLAKLSAAKLAEVFKDNASGPSSALCLEMMERLKDNYDLSNNDLIDSVIQSVDPAVVMSLLTKKKIDLRKCPNAINMALANPKVDANFISFLQINGAPLGSMNLSKLLDLTLKSGKPDLMFEQWFTTMDKTNFTKLIHEKLKESDYASTLDTLLQVMVKFKNKLNLMDKPNNGRTFFKLLYDALIAANHSLDKMPEIVGSARLNMEGMTDLFMKAMENKNYVFANMLAMNGFNLDSCACISFSAINYTDTLGKDTLAAFLGKLSPAKLSEVLSKNAGCKVHEEMVARFAGQVELPMLIQNGNTAGVKAFLVRNKLTDLSKFSNAIELALNNPKVDPQFIKFLQANGAPVNSIDFVSLLNKTLDAKNPDLMIDEWVAKLDKTAFTKLIHDKLNSTENFHHHDMLVKLLLKFKDKVDWMSGAPSWTFFKLLYTALGMNSYSLSKIPEMVGNLSIDMKLADNSLGWAMNKEEYVFLNFLLANGINFDACSCDFISRIAPNDTIAKEYLAVFLDKLSPDRFKAVMEQYVQKNSGISDEIVRRMNAKKSSYNPRSLFGGSNNGGNDGNLGTTSQPRMRGI